MADRELQDVPISVMVEQSLRDEFARLAASNDRAFSAEVRRAMRLHLVAEIRAGNFEPKEAA